MNSHQHQFQQNTQVGSGLTRYRSPSSCYFAGLLSTPNDGGFGWDDFEQLFNPRAASMETQEIFSRFMNNSTSDRPPITPHSPPLQQQKLEPKEYHHPQQSNNYSPAPPQIMYSTAPGSKVSDTKIERGGGAGLICHTSSPAGFFANINIEKHHGNLCEI